MLVRKVPKFLHPLGQWTFVAHLLYKYTYATTHLQYMLDSRAQSQVHIHIRNNRSSVYARKPSTVHKFLNIDFPKPCVFTGQLHYCKSPLCGLPLTCEETLQHTATLIILTAPRVGHVVTVLQSSLVTWLEQNAISFLFVTLQFWFYF